MDTSSDLFHFNEGALAYAGVYHHDHTSPLHSHSFVEIAFVTAGSATHQSLVGPADLGLGDVVVMRPGAWHGYDYCQDLVVYNCCFSADLLRRELAWTREDPLLGYLLWTGPYESKAGGVLTTHLDQETLEVCKAHLDALASAWHLPLAYYQGDIVGRLALLFSLLGRAVAEARALLVAPAGPTHPAIGQALRILEGSLDNPWTLTDLAFQLHLAPGYLVRLFKSSTGQPPMAYLARMRAEHAATLLLHTDEPVSHIGRAVGWPDQNYFARRFKAHYGLSPTTYRSRFGPGANGRRFTLGRH